MAYLPNKFVQTLFLLSIAIFNVSCKSDTNENAIDAIAVNDAMVSKRIAVGVHHTAVIKDDGTLWTWGRNRRGVLGDGTTVNRSTPAQVGTDNNWISIVTSDLINVNMGLKADGTLWAWGGNRARQYGDGTTTEHHIPFRIGTYRDWVDISVRGTWAAGIKRDGSLWVWGRNSNARRDDESTFYNSVPVRMGKDNDWAKISLGPYHGLAQKLDGTLWGWGSNGSGQVGDGTTTRALKPVQIGLDDDWKSFSAGEAHSVAVKNDGTLWAWGDASNDELGFPSVSHPPREVQPIPMRIGTSIDWEQVSATEDRTLALESDGTVWSWDPFGPAQIGEHSDWVDLIPGRWRSVAVKRDGSLWAWGNNYFGQLGNGESGQAQNKATPSQIGYDTLWRQVSAGDEVSAGIKQDGTLWVWGHDDYGMLGMGDLTRQFHPVQLGNENDWAYVATPNILGVNVVAIKSNGTLWAWGSNQSGALGNDTGAGSKVPLQVGEDSDWAYVVVGFVYTVALKSDGSLWAWGRNFDGNLGDGTQTSRKTPVQIAKDSAWTHITAGVDHTLAIKQDGTLWAWGDNDSGQLGDGTTVDRFSPVQIGTNANWVAVAAGGRHSTALRNDGTLWAWGNNSAGQLGDGTRTARSVPTRIGVDMDWSRVSAGNSHSVAVKTDGTLWTWGPARFEQFGWPDPDDGELYLTPTQIGLESDWVNVSTGNHHSISKKLDGGIYGWGLNYDGQLGLGVAGIEKNSSVPVSSFRLR